MKHLKAIWDVVGIIHVPLNWIFLIVAFVALLVFCLSCGALSVVDRDGNRIDTAEQAEVVLRKEADDEIERRKEQARRGLNRILGPARE